MKNKQIFSESTPPRHKGLFARFFALFFCLVMGMNVMGQTFSWDDATYTSSTKSYDVAGFGSVFKGTSPGTVSIINGGSYACGGYTGNVKSGSSMIIIKPAIAISGIRMNANTDSGPRTLTSVSKSNAINGTYTDITGATITPSTGIAKNTCAEYTFTFGAASGDFIKITMSGNWYYSSIELIPAGSSCSATAPGDITKGAKGNPLTLTAAGSPASGDTWYWQTASDGTSKTIQSGATYSVTAAGTYYVRSYNTSDDCWSTAKSVEVTEADLVDAPACVGELPHLYTFADWTAEAIETTKTADCMSVVGGSGKAVTIDASSKTAADGTAFTKRAKLGGTGASTNRYITVPVPGPCTITLYGMSGSGNTTRTMRVDAGSFGGTKLGELSNDGNSLGTLAVDYTGAEATTIYVYSTNSGCNIYGIRTTAIATKHHVTYAKGDGVVTGTVPTQADVAEGANFTVAAKGDLARDGFDFAGWNDGSADYAAGATYTMGSADVTLTAQWAAHVASSDATLSDLKVAGETVADFAAATENYNVVLPFGTVAVPTVTATAADANAKSVVVTPAASLPGATTVVVTAEDNTTTKTYTINFTVATSIDVEMVWNKSNKRCDGTTPAANVNSSAFAQYLSFAFAGGGAEGTSLNTSNNAGGSFTLSAKDGFAFKSMSFFGKLQADVEFSIDGGAFTTLVTTNTSADACYSDVFADAEVHELVLRNTAANGAWIRNMQLEVIASTTPFVKHNITYLETKGATNPNPATFIEGVGIASFADLADVDGWHFTGWDVTSIGTDVTEDVTVTASWESTLSNDVTLSSLRYGETAIATEADKFAYEVVLPYGAAVPTVSAIANHASATVGEITQAAEGNSYTASFTVTAQNPETHADYTVHFTWAPKQGVSIIKATHTGAATADVEGLIGGTVDKNTQAGGKLGGNDQYFGIKLAEGTFQTGDVLTIYASTTSTKVQIFSDKGTNMLNEGVFVDNVYTFTLEAATEWIYLYRTSTAGSAMNPTLGYMEVRRSMAPVITAFAIGEAEGVIDQENKTIAVEVANDADLVALTAPVITAVGNGGATVVTPAAQTDFSASVVFTATDAYGELSTNYTVTVTKGAAPAATPTIDTDLSSTASFVEGGSVTLSVVASTTDAGTLSYQWYKDETPVGTNASSLEVNAEGSYKVVVTNALSESNKATATSTTCVVTSTLPAGCYNITSAADGDNKYTFADGTILYSATSNGKANSSSSFRTSATKVSDCGGDEGDFSYNTKNLVFKFTKDLASITLYGTKGSDVTINKVTISETFDADTKLDVLDQVAFTEDHSRDNSCVMASADFTSGADCANKYLYVELSGSADIYRLCYTEALPLSADPAVATLVAETVCSDGTFATLDAVTAAEATYSYQWYKDDAEFATTQTINPTDGGVYYCKVTNSETDKRAVTKETNKVTLVRLTSGTTVSVEDGLAKTGETVELTATAAGAGTLTYAWYTCDDAEGTNPVVIGGADEATYTATVGTETAYYMVEVTGDCGTATAVATVNVQPESYELQDVTGDMTWDFTNKAAADGDVASTTKGDYEVLANTNIKSSFANKEYMAADYNKYTAKAIQATGLKIHTTVPGFISVTFAQTGSDKVRELYINGVATGAIPNGTTNMTYTQYVEAGDVVLTSWEASSSNWQMFNYAKVEFKAAAEVRTGLEAGRMYTYCPAQNVAEGKMYGAEFFVPESFDGFYVNLIEVDELTAGHGYIMIPTAETVYALFDGDVLTEAVDASAATHGMQGFLSADPSATQVIGDSEDNIVVINNHLHYAGGNYMGVGRAYIRLDIVRTLDAQTENPAPRRRVGFEGTVATDINALDQNVEAQKVLMDGVLYIIRAGKMYNVNGQLLK